MPKGKPISEDVQWIIVRLGAAFLPEEISMYTNVSECKVRAILTHHKRTRGVDIAKRERPNLYQKLQDEDIKHLWTILSSTLDVYLDELCLELEEKHGVSVLASMIWRTLVKGGYSMKKLSRMALERSMEKRSIFATWIRTYEPNQLVFVDESSVDHRTTYRGRAWAICGMKATRKAFFCRGKRYSVLPALSLEQGVLHCDIIEGTFNTTEFYKFIDHTLDQMQQFPNPNSVIVMDNCRIQIS